jgi:DNA-binding NtrC family response regulator
VIEMTANAQTTRALEVRSDAYVFQRFALRVVEGPDVGRVAVSNGEESTVGTEAGNDLVLSDPTVSRHHFALRATADGLELSDLDSTNGTVMGGYRVRAAFVEPNALIRAGRSVIQVELGDGQVREELSPRRQFGRLHGDSAAMRRLFTILERFAPTDGTVLLEGETGTGKELAAESIHEQSPRARGPFVVVDCGAISPSLIESELFGHVRGAFTGADRNRIGALEAAHGGTLFLDEIGELALAVQPTLLRALETRSFRRIGGDRPIAADFRVIAATNRDLRHEVNRSRFRADLFYRLAVLRVRLPPLREREGDVALLVRQFCAELHAGETEPARLPDDLVTALEWQRWPGNVRELRTAVQRALILGDAARWRESSGGPALPTDGGEQPARYGEAKTRAIEAWEARYVRRLMDDAAGNLSRAARSAGMSRAHLRELLVRYRLVE